MLKSPFILFPVIAAAAAAQAADPAVPAVPAAPAVRCLVVTSQQQGGGTSHQVRCPAAELPRGAADPARPAAAPTPARPPAGAAGE